MPPARWSWRCCGPSASLRAVAKGILLLTRKVSFAKVTMRAMYCAYRPDPIQPFERLRLRGLNFANGCAFVTANGNPRQALRTTPPPARMPTIHSRT